MFSVELVCLVAGPIIALLVSAFKKLSFVQQYPKVVAALLSVVVAVVSGLTLEGLDWQMLAGCIVVPFATAVATYEVAIKPVADNRMI